MNPRGAAQRITHVDHAGLTPSANPHLTVDDGTGNPHLATHTGPLRTRLRDRYAATARWSDPEWHDRADAHHDAHD